ncbi:hypothetical protein L1887_50211 [Cichorium endivia]|nr:hypothetical protein L1887_50211 [Cichorium endivia]
MQSEVHLQRLEQQLRGGKRQEASAAELVVEATANSPSCSTARHRMPRPSRQQPRQRRGRRAPELQPSASRRGAKARRERSIACGRRDGAKTMTTVRKSEKPQDAARGGAQGEAARIPAQAAQGLGAGG